jgi:hypothetical protein
VLWFLVRALFQVKAILEIATLLLRTRDAEQECKAALGAVLIFLSNF